VANPRARVRIGSEEREVIARVATPEERERLWPRLDRLWPAYDTYRRRSGREIRVFVLEPVDEAVTGPN
jgi:F420H(2)-dependent quinone reductase